MLARLAQAWLPPLAPVLPLPLPPPLLLLLLFLLLLALPPTLSALDLLLPPLQRPWLRSGASTRVLTCLRGCTLSSAT